MEKKFAFIIVSIILGYGFYQAQKKESKHIPSNTHYQKHIQDHRTSHYIDELKQLHTTPYRKQYIIDVINHGSEQLHFKSTEIMDKGFASSEDAPKIACYILALSGTPCKESYPNEAQMFYSSNCAGCHGEDAKGAAGTYPDLTKKVLLGIEKKENLLKKLIKLEKSH